MAIMGPDGNPQTMLLDQNNADNAEMVFRMPEKTKDLEEADWTCACTLVMKFSELACKFGTHKRIKGSEKEWTCKCKVRNPLNEQKCKVDKCSLANFKGFWTCGCSLKNKSSMGKCKFKVHAKNEATSTFWECKCLTKNIPNSKKCEYTICSKPQEVVPVNAQEKPKIQMTISFIQYSLVGLYGKPYDPAKDYTCMCFYTAANYLYK